MIRSRFQHSFVIQSVLHSYLVGFVLFCVQHCNYSHLPLQCLCIESEVCTHTGYELYELLLIIIHVSRITLNCHYIAKRCYLLQAMFN